MRTLAGLTILGLLTVAPHAWAGPPAGLCKGRCLLPPPPLCLDCPDPCAHRLRLTVFPVSHGQTLIAQLSDPSWCVRQRAAQKLGCRLHADFCCDPAVLHALLSALSCDPCWHVRRAAAAALEGQGASTPDALLFLYVCSRLDPHYLVRDRAVRAIDVLTAPAVPCYKTLFETGDKLITELRKQSYRPGSEKCHLIFALACARCGLTVGGVSAAQPAASTEPQSPARPPEQLPVPRKR